LSDQSLPQHVSPLSWTHFNQTGDYVSDTEATERLNEGPLLLGGALKWWGEMQNQQKEWLRIAGRPNFARTSILRLKGCVHEKTPAAKARGLSRL